MKVQTDGLLVDFRTTNPPGPFSPLRNHGQTRQRERGAVVVVGVEGGWCRKEDQTEPSDR